MIKFEKYSDYVSGRHELGHFETGYRAFYNGVEVGKIRKCGGYKIVFFDDVIQENGFYKDEDYTKENFQKLNYAKRYFKDAMGCL